MKRRCETRWQEVRLCGKSSLIQQSYGEHFMERHRHAGSTYTGHYRKPFNVSILELAWKKTEIAREKYLFESADARLSKSDRLELRFSHRTLHARLGNHEWKIPVRNGPIWRGAGYGPRA